jgi:hypothetical protein
VRSSRIQVGKAREEEGPPKRDQNDRVLGHLEPTDLWNFFHQDRLNESAKFEAKKIAPLS